MAQQCRFGVLKPLKKWKAGGHPVDTNDVPNCQYNEIINNTQWIVAVVAHATHRNQGKSPGFYREFDVSHAAVFHSRISEEANK